MCAWSRPVRIGSSPLASYAPLFAHGSGRPEAVARNFCRRGDLDEEIGAIQPDYLDGGGHGVRFGAELPRMSPAVMKASMSVT
jgi:hypothetical protein